jgi:hypothetical protein
MTGLDPQQHPPVLVGTELMFRFFSNEQTCTEPCCSRRSDNALSTTKKNLHTCRDNTAVSSARPGLTSGCDAREAKRRQRRGSIETRGLETVVKRVRNIFQLTGTLICGYS